MRIDGGTDPLPASLLEEWEPCSYKNATGYWNPIVGGVHMGLTQGEGRKYGFTPVRELPYQRIRDAVRVIRMDLERGDFESAVRWLADNFAPKERDE